MEYFIHYILPFSFNTITIQAGKVVCSMLVVLWFDILLGLKLEVMWGRGVGGGER